MKLNAYLPKRSRIEMMPLIDSFFLILVYFIYAFLSMSVHKGVPLDLPKAATAQDDRAEYIGVSVDEDGQISLDKKQVSIQELRQELNDIQKFQSEAQIYIFGDVLAPHGQVVRVLDIIREVGIEKVLIQTDPN